VRSWRSEAFNQFGLKFLGDALYMPALAAARHYPDLAKKYPFKVQQENLPTWPSQH